MHGVSATQFAPNSELSRAMLVKMLYNLEKQDTKSKNSSQFTDVADDIWYTEAIDWAASNNIVSGYPDQTFKPNNAISRQEMMAILYRYAKYKNYDVSATGDLSVFEDADTIANWAKEKVSWAVGAGLIHGMGDNTLAPNGTATRAEGAQLMQQFFELIVK